MAAMYEHAVSAFLISLAIYALAGLLAAVPFLIFGITRIDEQAHGAGAGFKLIILAGVVALWPLLLRKWLLARRTREDA
jgi:hypothetical protein